MRLLLCLCFILISPGASAETNNDITPHLKKTGEVLCQAHFDSLFNQANGEKRIFLRRQKKIILHKCRSSHFAAGVRCSESFLKEVEVLADGEALNDKKIKHMNSHIRPKLLACLDKSNAKTKVDIQTLGHLSR